MAKVHRFLVSRGITKVDSMLSYGHIWFSRDRLLVSRVVEALRIPSIITL